MMSKMMTSVKILVANLPWALNASHLENSTWIDNLKKFRVEQATPYFDETVFSTSQLLIVNQTWGTGCHTQSTCYIQSPNSQGWKKGLEWMRHLLKEINFKVMTSIKILVANLPWALNASHLENSTRIFNFKKPTEWWASTYIHFKKLIFIQVIYCKPIAK